MEWSVVSGDLAGEGVALVWVVAHLVGAPLAQAQLASRGYGFYADEPCWRNGLMIPTQLFTLPALWVLAMPGWSGLQAWSRVCDQCGWGRFGWAFAWIFPTAMLLDWALIDMPLQLTAHHLACLAGHLAGCIFVPPAGFPYYFSGVVALEVGSGANNYYMVDPCLPSALLWFVVMSVSNLVCAWATYHGLQHAKGPAKTFVMALVPVLLFLRQRECCQGLMFELALVA